MIPKAFSNEFLNDSPSEKIQGLSKDFQRVLIDFQSVFKLLSIIRFLLGNRLEISLKTLSDSLQILWGSLEKYIENPLGFFLFFC